jgi:hypothetical protein
MGAVYPAPSNLPRLWYNASQSLSHRQPLLVVYSRKLRGGPQCFAPGDMGCRYRPPDDTPKFCLHAPILLCDAEALIAMPTMGPAGVNGRAARAAPPSPRALLSRQPRALSRPQSSLSPPVRRMDLVTIGGRATSTVVPVLQPPTHQDLRAMAPLSMRRQVAKAHLSPQT